MMPAACKRECITAFFIVLAVLLQGPPARAAATLLPPGEQCFQATSPTSGGLSGPLTTLGTITGGSGYVSATYTNVPLTGGSGFGATATITVTSGSVASVSITNPGTHYAGGDTLSAAAASLGGSGSGFSVPVVSVSTTGTGMLGLLGAITGGSAGTAGAYGGVTLTGGSGSGGTANITVSGGAVTAVVILNPGTGYAVGDILSAASGSIGGVTGFSVPVSSVAINMALAGGSVGMFIPNTNTLKQTWQNSTQTILNQNPVVLDQNGCATIYGTGSYRQVLKDALGNVVWDKLTTDTSAQQNTFWAGNAGGTPNAIVLTDPGFNGTDGSIINFFPVAVNTTATTISVASTAFTNISVVKDTTGGPISLTGGEIVGTSPADVVSVVYSALQNNFHLLNTAIASASGATAPLCGASGLKITNGASPASIILLTAGQIVLQAANGLTINRSNVSLTNINITTGNGTSTANGMDGEAPGTSNWLYVWAIDNGAAPAGLVSSATGNGLAPILPSGYTYKCRLGAMRISSGSLLFTTQLGSEAQYVVQASGALPIITSTIGATFWTAQSVVNFVPPTATRIKIAAEFSLTVIDNNTGAASAAAGVAPNANYASPGSTGRTPCGVLRSLPAVVANITTTDNNICDLVLESTNIYTGSNVTVSGSGSATAAGVIAALGWKDSVNAN
jgi:hypothetical protein